MATTRFIRWFRDITMADVGLVGGKNASLGEMCRELIPRGISVPNGFAITAAGCLTDKSREGSFPCLARCAIT